MIDFFVLALVKLLLWLRYRIRVRGLARVARRGRRGILFLANHPAMVDPPIVLSRLFYPFRARALADRDQIDRFFIRFLARRVNVLPIPDMTKLESSAGEATAVIDECAKALAAGDNLLLYPAGQNYRSRHESLGASRAAHDILQRLPEVRVVLIRTTGLWGSSLSWAHGSEPHVASAVGRGVRGLLASGVFFAPRRCVRIELHEPADLPRTADRGTINRYLEAFYNRLAPPRTYVPYHLFEPGGERVLPEPTPPRIEGDLARVSEHTRGIVRDILAEVTGIGKKGSGSRLPERPEGCFAQTTPGPFFPFTDDQHLARDLGMDSLAKLELLTAIQAEFGAAVAGVEAIRTVGDVMLAAAGQATGASQQLAIAVPRAWRRKPARLSRPQHLADSTIAAAFLRQAKRNARRVILADQAGGARTYRDLVTACLALQRPIRDLPGECVGIMMPASVGAAVSYLAAMFAGKTPVMVNWTLGRKNLLHCLDSVGARRILTAGLVVGRLRGQGVDVDAIADRIVPIESLAAGLGRTAKLAAALRSRLCWGRLRRAKVSDTAAVLFTSGSESVPKAVPLTHRNMLVNIADAFDAVALQPADAMLGILPPFHSFGLTASLVLPLVLGMRTAYSPNPTDGATLARMIAACRPTVLMGTPTFLDGIVRAASAGQLDSLRLAVSGAEKCPPRVYDALAARCPACIVLEGYGITECSPIVSVNRPEAPRAGTIGRPLASVEHAVVATDLARRVAAGADGLLLVRGPSIFDGYLRYDGPSPFVEFEGRSWYRTGDLVREEPDGTLVFAGRLKRFVKLAGEMISLPAIEAVLEPHLAADPAEGPAFAVVAAEQDNPEVVLFTTRPVSREQANAWIRAAGFSGLHNIRRVIQTDEPLPLLGTGKTDYRALAARL